MAILAEIVDQVVMITARHAGQWVSLGDQITIAERDGQELRLSGTGTITLSEGWWDNAGIFPDDYTGPWAPATTSETVAHRLERSDDDGQTWATIADELGLDPTWNDDRVALNTRPLYRAASISPIGVETLSVEVPVETITERVWLAGENGASICLTVGIELNAEHQQERVIEQYFGDTLPTAHYGAARPLSVQVSGQQVEGLGYDSDPTVLLGQDIWYRDPERRAFWGSIESVSTPQSVRGLRGFAVTVEAVEHGEA